MQVRPSNRSLLSLALGVAAALLAGCEAGPTGQGAEVMNLVSVPATQAQASGGAPAATRTDPVEVAMRWSHRPGSDSWTSATLTALDRHGAGMLSRVPGDVSAFCPGYAAQDLDGRRAFWAGLMSALAKHESTYNAQARGGGGKWLGLMQIAPATWKHYGCSGQMLNGADNAACAVRIMSRQVGRDNAVAGSKGNWRGVARDWAPLRSASKRADIAGWTSQQSYCRPVG